ncbi:MAG: response regulator [Ignavibacteriales bacterium]
MKILLVEDQLIVALTEVRIIKKLGYEVISASSASETIDIINTKEKIDLIIMDINLGAGIDGLELAEIIKDEHEIPIIFMSSHIEPEIIKQAENISGNVYILKTLDQFIIGDAIKKVLYK